jgi:short-subunit dehydrogenase involved in D-alanine esterification of teichoic acids
MDYIDAMKKAVKQSNEEQKALVDRYDNMTWEKEFDNLDVIIENAKLVKQFISDLLLKQQSRLLRKHEETIDFVLKAREHDNEILVNTLIDTKNAEIKARDEEWLSCLPGYRSWVGWDSCVKSIEEKAKAKGLIK